MSTEWGSLEWSIQRPLPRICYFGLKMLGLNRKGKSQRNCWISDLRVMGKDGLIGSHAKSVRALRHPSFHAPNLSWSGGGFHSGAGLSVLWWQTACVQGWLETPCSQRCWDHQASHGSTPLSSLLAIKAGPGEFQRWPHPPGSQGSTAGRELASKVILSLSAAALAFTVCPFSSGFTC